MKGTVFNQMVEQALMQVHTGFVAKVVNVSGDLASVQPLNMIQAAGGKSQKQAVIPNCPVLQSARRFIQSDVRSSTESDPFHSHTVKTWDVVGVVPGDIVYCVCADRDISETRTGEFATPVTGHHTLSSAVIVGIL